MKDVNILTSNGVNVQQSLELFGDAQTYNDTIGEFLVGIHSKINELIEMMNNSDINNYAITVHSLKSDAKYFGFTKLAEIAEEHENKSKEGDLYYITSHINDLINETNNAIVLIQEYMNSDEVVTSNTENPESNGEVYTSKTILVVDDSNIVRNFVKRIFSDEYNVGTAKDGEEAIEILKANKDNGLIETVLLDLNMPKVDGFAVLEFMRQSGMLETIPVSIISGDSSKETIDRAFTYGIIDMLEKPFTEQNIKTVIEKTMLYKEMQ